MPLRKLIIDRAALDLAAAKLSGSPIFAGPGGQLLAPGVIDVVETDENSGEQPWFPANALARLFVAGAEACREIDFLAPAALDARTRRRALKSLTVPVCSLMDVVESICRQLNASNARAHRETWPAHDRGTYVSVAKRLRKQHLQGPVRKVRNKLGAHLDSDTFGPGFPKLTPEDLLGAMRDALILLMLGLNHPSEYFSWIRWLGTTSDDHDLVETMQAYPATVRWIADRSGRVLDVLPIRLAQDPRKQIQADVTAAIDTYNELVSPVASTLGTLHLSFRAASRPDKDAAGPR